MKTIRKLLKPVTLILSMLILFQGCTVYKSGYVTLDEAVRSETVVKVYTNNKTQKFKRIEIENGRYFGVRNIYGKMVKLQIDKSMVEKVQLRDKTLSTALSFASPFVIFFGFILVNGGLL